MTKDTFKTCTKCGIRQPFEMYIARTDRPGKRQSHCKTCVSGYNAELYRLDRERRIRQALAWQAANPERFAASVQAYQRNNPERRRQAEHRRRALVANTYAFSPDLITARIAYFGGKCWMCGAEGETVDHVKPLSVGGPHIPANIRPACRPCNSGKQARWFGTSELHRFSRAT